MEAGEWTRISNPPHLPTPLPQGWTPLQSAVSSGHEEVTRALLSLGADANQANAQGRTPLHYAASKGRLPLLRLLLQGQGARAARRDDSASRRPSTSALPPPKPPYPNPLNPHPLNPRAVRLVHHHRQPGRPAPAALRGGGVLGGTVRAEHCPASPPDGPAAAGW